MEFWVLLIKLLWKLHLYSFVEVYPHVLPEFSISNCRKLYFSKMPIMSICYSYIKIKELTSPSKVFPGGSAVPIQETQEMWVRSLRLGRSPGGGNGNPLQYSCLGNPMDRGAWCATVHGVTKSRT